ncbi:MAG: transcriptional regulator, partial [Actinobacteria bacterium]
MTDTNTDSNLGYRSPQVCKVVGITYRQLDYWDRSGLLGPSMQVASGSGTQRLYTFQDIVTLRVIKRLKD